MRMNVVVKNHHSIQVSMNRTVKYSPPAIKLLHSHASIYKYMSHQSKSSPWSRACTYTSIFTVLLRLSYYSYNGTRAINWPQSNVWSHINTYLVIQHELQCYSKIKKTTVSHYSKMMSSSWQYLNFWVMTKWRVVFTCAHVLENK
jgi:hypothetical protein